VGAIEVKCRTDRLEGIYVQIGLEDKLMRISSSYLTDWLESKGYSRPMFMKALERQFGMRDVVARLGSGTDLRLGEEYLIQIDLSGSALASLIEEV
jgi:hypothetical protein